MLPRAPHTVGLFMCALPTVLQSIACSPLHSSETRLYAWLRKLAAHERHGSLPESDARYGTQFKRNQHLEGRLTGMRQKRNPLSRGEEVGRPMGCGAHARMPV
jgi:hypothetical protein